MRIRTHRGTVRWSPSLEEAVLVTHHLFAGEHLHTRQGLALLLPLAHLGRRANLFSNGVNNEVFHKKNVLLERTFSGQNNPRMKVKTYLACSRFCHPATR